MPPSRRFRRVNEGLFKDVSAGTRPRRARRVLRVCVRWLGVLLAFLLVGVILLGFFLNRVGMPEFVRARLVVALRQHGWDVHFSRLRWRWHRGLVADDLQLQRTNRLEGPQLFIEEASCTLSSTALSRLEILPTAVQIHGGRLAWAVERHGRPRRFLDLRDLQGELSFKSDDTWELHSLRAAYRGLRLRWNGTLTNASALRDWSYVRPPSAKPDALLEWLDRVESIAHRVSVGGTPELDAVVHGDARTFQNFHAGIVLRAAGFESPWGRGTNVMLSGQLITGQTSNDTPHAEIRLSADDAHTPWAEASRALLTAQFAPSWTEWVPTRARVEVQLNSARIARGRARQVRLNVQSSPAATNLAARATQFQLTAAEPSTTWGTASQVLITGDLTHPSTHWIPASGSASWTWEHLRTRWGGAEVAHLQSTGFLFSNRALGQAGRPWPDRWADVAFAVDGVLTNVSTAKGNLDGLLVAARWRLPQFHVEARADQEGAVDARVDLDTATRNTTFSVASRLFPASGFPWLGTNARAWLAQLACDTPPRLEARGRFVLPEWTNRAPDWRRTVLPTVEAAARLELGEASFRGVRLQSLLSSLALTNQHLQIRDLTLTRPEGGLMAEGGWDIGTQDFRADLSSQMDLRAAKAFFEQPKVRQAFNLVQWTQPPHVQLQVRGNFNDWSQLTGVGRVALTNFTVNGEFANDCVARVVYTNRWLAILSPQIRREDQMATADRLVFHLQPGHERLFLTNAHGDLNPYALLRAINTNTARIISRYVFETSPTITANGIVGLRAQDKAEDLHLRVEGGPFRWHMFKLPHIAGQVHVCGETVRLSNVAGQFYGGEIRGKAFFDWSVARGTDAAFMVTTSESDLGALMADVSNQPNQLDGKLSGFLDVTHANSDDPLSWQGYGTLKLTNGLIWDFPVFGTVSKMLNAFVPGLGNSRAKQATADYSITNSVIYTRNTDIRATGMRVHFHGTVGFDQALDARVEAELLRDLPALGFLVSKVFWPVTKLFVLKVTGTWNRPQTEPLYIIPNFLSKIVLLPFRPWNTMKEIFPLEPAGGGEPALNPPPHALPE